MRAYRKPGWRQAIWGYTHAFSGTPLLVRTYLCCFGFGQFEGMRNSFLWGPVLIDPWWCVLIACTLNTAAFTTEFLKGAIETAPRGEIQKLEEGYPTNELWQVITGQQEGRKDTRQITLFDSVGFAIEDFSALRCIHRAIQGTGFYADLDLLADPDDPPRSARHADPCERLKR
ncbi:hypothetical protein RA19_24280 [Leisingera sp. ANG-M1]|uniref:hypothetical protein n=1 Tax=Leisingera sp. ANG-M1 TaxID=1577895 RepID=UPI00057E45AE|nr:hypothetical protein RA19_24280 [Leisingera sp. ANG-M1]